MLSFICRSVGHFTVNRPWSGFPCNWRYINVETFNLFLTFNSFARNFRLEFWVIGNPRSRGRGGRTGSGMVTFERVLVSSYRLSTVTFLLSLRVSEILPLVLQQTTFPHPTSSLPSRWMAFVRAINFQDFQPMWSWSTDVKVSSSYILFALRNIMQKIMSMTVKQTINATEDSVQYTPVALTHTQ